MSEIFRKTDSSRRNLHGAQRQMSGLGVALLTTTFMVSGSSAMAQASMFGCPDNATGPIAGDPAPFPGGLCDIDPTNSTGSLAFDVSGDGSVVVGFVNQQGGPVAPFRWTIAGGLTLLPALPSEDAGGPYTTRVRGANLDGTVLAGNSIVRANGYVKSVRWVNGVIEDLGALSGFNGQGNAWAVNHAGNVVVGFSTSESSDTAGRRAFRWVENRTDGRGTANNFEMQDLGTLNDDQATGFSRALDVNAAGNVVVGFAQELGALNAPTRAFRWVENRTDGRGVIGNLEMQDLGTLTTDQSGQAEAKGVNTVGDVVVGYAVNDDGLRRAFRWVENRTDGGGIAANPEMEDLGTLTSDQSGGAEAYAVSANGNVVVGRASNGTNLRAFRWLEGSDYGGPNPQMQDLGTLRSDNAGNSLAWGVSDDGRIVVGEAAADDGTSRAFIWSSQMQDYENLFESFSDLADDTEIAVAQQQHMLGRTLDTTCFAGMELQGGAPIGKVLPDIYVGGKNDTDAIAEEVEEVFINECFRASGWLSITDADTAQDIGTRDSGMASLTYGRAVDAQTTVGGTIAVHATSLASHSFDMGAGITGSVWAEYSETGHAHLGWQGGAAVGWGLESGTITRGLGLANVMPASGEADLSTFGARATIGYGMDRGDWLVTPGVTLAQFNTRRSAYSESGSDFDASYDALSLKRTVAKLQVNAARALSETGTLLVGLGLEHDISVDPVVLTGTTDGMPGLETFVIDSRLDRRDTRFDAMIGWEQDLGANRVVGATLRAGQAVFGDAARIDLGVSYTVRF